MEVKKRDTSIITYREGVEPILVKFSGRAGLGSDSQHCNQSPELNLTVVVEEALRWEVEGEQTLEQSCLEEVVEPLLRLRPCTVGNIGRMLHSHRKLHTGLGLHHNIEHIEQHSRLQLLGCLLRVLMR
jgi:hypothetical protein